MAIAESGAMAHGYGVHSEAGKLRKVLVCSPGLAHSRLTPSNKDDRLFDELPWVQQAQRGSRLSAPSWAGAGTAGTA
jgi:hypothetical protein